MQAVGECCQGTNSEAAGCQHRAGQPLTRTVAAALAGRNLWWLEDPCDPLDFETLVWGRLGGPRGLRVPPLRLFRGRRWWLRPSRAASGPQRRGIVRRTAPEPLGIALVRRNPRVVYPATTTAAIGGRWCPVCSRCWRGET